MKKVLLLYALGLAVLSTQDENVCRTEECKRTARRFLASMDQTVNPCEDFYDFACGNFMRKAKIPDDKVKVSNTSPMTLVIYKQLKSIFTNSSLKMEANPFKKLRRYFSMCMNQETINRRGLAPAVQLLRAAGGWPLLDKLWRGTGWKFTFAEQNLMRLINVDGILIKVQVTRDHNDPSRKIIKIDQPEMGLPEEYLIKGHGDKMVKTYFRYMEGMAKLLGADMAYAASDLNATLDFSISLAKIMTKRELRRNAQRMNNGFTLRELEKKWPWLDWAQFLQGLMPPGLTLLNNEYVVVAEIEYLTRLEDLLKKYPSRTIANYMGWRAIEVIAPLLTGDVQDLKKEVDQATKGTSVMPPRCRQCLNFALSENTFAIALSALYAKQFFDISSKEKVADMTERIRAEMIGLIKTTNWMANTTKNKAIQKASVMKKIVGFPDEILDDLNLKEYYKDVKMNKTHFLEASLDLGQWHRHFVWSGLRVEMDPMLEWWENTYVTEANAFYSPERNLIALSAAFLQPPLFHAELPWPVNYGGIGMVIGHEITHGFDDQGRQFDDKGHLKNWWDELSKASFDKQKKCIVDQYSAFNDTKHTNMTLNGNNTQGENIADNGAMRMGYRALSKKVGDNDTKLPGLEGFSSEQLFFLSWGNQWCTKARVEHMENTIKTDPHSPAEFRVKGPLMNFPRFSKAFDCRPKDYMNPPKKCRVW